MGLPFSGPLAGDGMGGLLVRVSPTVLTRYLCHHANGFYARQPHHPPSTHLDASKVKKSQFKADCCRSNFQTAVLRLSISPQQSSLTVSNVVLISRSAGRAFDAFGHLVLPHRTHSGRLRLATYCIQKKDTL